VAEALGRREDIVKRLHLIVATALGFLSVAVVPPAPAQDWPSKPVHILVGFGAGAARSSVFFSQPKSDTGIKWPIN
jgi:hypothetical protein